MNNPNAIYVIEISKDFKFETFSKTWYSMSVDLTQMYSGKKYLLKTFNLTSKLQLH